MAVFEALNYWLDKDPRSGAENMAVDQLLMEGVGETPILRVYHWSEPTVTFGYFLALEEARAAFPAMPDRPLTYIRRWTGGGIVDHRIDLTYTVVVPRSHALATERGAESYRVIHQALADTLAGLGDDVHLTSEDVGDGGLSCFTNPVAYDLTESTGGKIAGAGQRRSRYGLLHQGSVITARRGDEFGGQLVRNLSTNVSEMVPDADFFQDSKALAASRYNTDSWLKKK